MKPLRIEILFPEVANLYGDLGNIRYIQASRPDSMVYETSLFDAPRFLTEEIDLVYMGTLTEEGMLLAIEKLLPYRKRILESIQKGQHFLLTGNALEILGSHLEIAQDVSGKKPAVSTIPALSLLPFYAKAHMLQRYNGLYVGKYKDIQVVGFKSQFSHSYFTDMGTARPLFENIRGAGIHPQADFEGFSLGNLWATYLIGPILVLNPPLLKLLLEKLQSPGPLAFEDTALQAYEERVREFLDPNRPVTYDS